MKFVASVRTNYPWTGLKRSDSHEGVKFGEAVPVEMSDTMKNKIRRKILHHHAGLITYKFLESILALKKMREKEREREKQEASCILLIHFKEAKFS